MSALLAACHVRHETASCRGRSIPRLGTPDSARAGADEMMGAPRLIACVRISMPTAMRSFSRGTAASIAVLVHHAFDDVRGGELVNSQRGGVDRFGGKRLPL